MSIQNYLYFVLLINITAYSQNQDWVYRNPLPQNDFYAIRFFDHNTGYVCGSNGAILKTLTGDNNWINLSISSSRQLYGMHFFDFNNGFIAGDSGLIIRTTSGGNNWIRITTGITYDLRSITFPNPGTGFAAGANGVIIKSTNGGTSWTVINNNSRELRSIFFLNANTGFAVGDSGIVMKTTNSGGSWNAQTIGEWYPARILNSVFFTNSTVGYIVSSIGEFFKSTNGGTNWIHTPTSGWNNLRSIRFVNEFTGYAVGNYFLRTTNAGENWSPMPVGGTNNYSLNDISITDTNIFICSLKGYIFKTGTGIGIYDVRNIGGSKHNFSSISFVNENTGFMVSQDQYWRTINGGLNWSNDGLIKNGFDGAGPQSNYNSISFFSQSSGYQIIHTLYPTMYSQEYLYQTTNAGISWNGPKYFTQTAALINGVCETEGITYITIGAGGIGGPPSAILKNSGFGWVTMFSQSSISLNWLSFSNQNTGVVVSNNPARRILRTSNGGVNWNLNISPSTKRITDIQILPSGYGWFTGDSTLLGRTMDFGATWNLIQLNLPSEFLKLQFIDNNTGWIIGRHPQSAYRLYRTTNSGTSLMLIQSLQNFNVKGMSFLNSLTGYVCGDSGAVLKTTNGGLTFVDPVFSNSPDKFHLCQNYPNPFNPSTTIKFSIPPSKGARGMIQLIIYDVLGREIASLVNEQLQPGTYDIEWSATGGGSNYPSGVYFYKLITADYTETRKMVLVK